MPDSQGGLPEWARWLIQFGVKTARAKPTDGQQEWTVLTVPDRRLAASLIALGGVMANREKEGPVGGLSRFDGLKEGSPLKWVNGNGESVFGHLVKIEDGFIHYKQRVHGGWSPAYRPLDKASSFWPCADDDEFVGARPLTAWPDLVDAVVGGHKDTFLSTSRIDVLLLGRKTELEADLKDPGFPAGEFAGPLTSLVRPKSLVPKGEHYRSELLSGVSDPEDLDRVTAPMTVVDGAQAYIRLKEALRSPSVVVVLDRWLPSSKDAADAAMIDRMFGWVDADASSIAFPDGIELFRWTAAL